MLSCGEKACGVWIGVECPSHVSSIETNCTVVNGREHACVEMSFREECSGSISCIMAPYNASAPCWVALAV